MATIFGTNGDDVENGTNGNDLIVGRKGDDELNGNDGHDLIFGGKGDDDIDGGSGNDYLDGGKGSDTIEGGEGNDWIEGGRGHDTAVYAGSILDYTVDAVPGFFRFFDFNKDDFIVEDQNASDGDTGRDYIDGIEKLQFDDYTLDLTGGNNPPLVLGGNQVTDEETATTFTVDAYDFDGDGLSLDNINYTGPGTLVLVGTEAIDANLGTGVRFTFTFDPNGEFDDLNDGESQVEGAAISISDGEGGVATLNFDIKVDGIGDAATAVDDTAQTDEDTTVMNIDVLANDEGTGLTVESALAGNGQVTINPDGTLNYTPDPDFNGTDTISYEIMDADGNMSSAVVTVTVDAVNDGPVANADTASVDEDGAVNIDVLGNDTDVENDTLEVTSANAPNGGVVIETDGSLTYTPDPDFNGTDTITYTISDGNGGTSTATVEVTVNAVNDGPVAVADSASVDEDGSVDIAVLDNDSDADGDTLSVTGASATSGSVVVNANGTITYTPNPNFNGSDTIVYTISDGNGGTDTAEVAVTVNAVNDGPVAAADTASVDEDGTVDIIVLDNDTDADGDTLEVTGASAPNGAVVVNADGTLTYTPNADFNGTDTITYTISDGNGGTATADVTVTVNPVNDAPEPAAANDPAIVANEADGEAVIDVLGRVTDVDGDDVSIVNARLIDPSSGRPIAANLIINEDGTITLDPEDLGLGNGQTRDVQIQYTVDDGSGAANSSATGLIDVTVIGSEPPPPPTNNPPNADDLIDVATPRLEADGLITFDLSDQISDPDPGDVVTITRIVGPEGLAENAIISGQTVTIDPRFFGLDAGDTQFVSFLYFIDDGSGVGLTTDSARVTFQLEGSNDAPPPPPPPDNTMPVADDLATTVNEVDGDAVIDLNALVSDADEGDVLTITGVTAPEGVTIDFSLESGVLIVDTASAGLDDGEALTIDFTYAVEDDSEESNSEATGTVSLTINGFTDAPPPPPPTQIVLDFEQFSSRDDSSIDIAELDIQGFVFEANATVIETDEVGGGRGPNGIVLGQTTPGGDNVLVGNFTEEEVPVLDEFGNPVIDPGTRLPVTETVRLEDFAFYTADNQFQIGETTNIIGQGLATDPVPDISTFDPSLLEGFGDSFDLDGLSLNLSSGGFSDIKITTYTIGVATIENDFNPSFVQYAAALVEADSFVFNADSATPAEILDFNDPGFVDDAGNTNSSGFDDIYAVVIEADNQVAVVLDDILITI